MDISFLIAMLLPIILYVFVDLKYGMKAGIITALVLTVFLGIFFFFKMGHLDNLLLMDGGMLLGLGLLSIRLNNSKLFKLQPTIIGAILVVYCLYLQIYDSPIMVRMMPMIKVAAPEQAAIFETEAGINMLTDFSLYMTILIGVHAVMVGYAALRLNNFLWLAARLAIYPLMLGLSVAIAIMHSGAIASALPG